MKVLILMLAIAVLFMNLSGYKGYFKSAKLREFEFKAKMAEQKDKEVAKGILFIVLTVLAILTFTFYVIAGNVFGSGLLLIYSVYMALRTIFWYFKSLKQIVDEKIVAKGILWRIMLPINTLYIIYFMYYYM